eukprot:jgi/Ulvmu1/4614/UM002_0343.1
MEHGCASRGWLCMPTGLGLRDVSRCAAPGLQLGTCKTALHKLDRLVLLATWQMARDVWLVLLCVDLNGVFGGPTSDSLVQVVYSLPQDQQVRHLVKLFDSHTFRMSRQAHAVLDALGRHSCLPAQHPPLTPSQWTTVMLLAGKPPSSLQVARCKTVKFTWHCDQAHQHV